MRSRGGWALGRGGCAGVGLAFLRWCLVVLALTLATPALSAIPAQTDSAATKDGPRIEAIRGRFVDPAASILAAAWDDSSAVTEFCVTAWAVVHGQLVIGAVQPEVSAVCERATPRVILHRNRDPRLAQSEAIEAALHARPFVVVQVDHALSVAFFETNQDGAPVIGGLKSERRP